MLIKFTSIAAMLDIVNNDTETIICKPEEMIGIVDLRSFGYYKIKQGILQQNLNKYYRFERAETLCKYFNKFINTLKKGREQIEPEERYPWLHSSDERKYMTDQEILGKYIDLDSSCLTKEEKKKVMKMLYRYKESLCRFLILLYCYILVRFSLIQNISLFQRQAFNHHCDLHQV